jgi:hypothetical protein
MQTIKQIAEGLRSGSITVEQVVAYEDKWTLEGVIKELLKSQPECENNINYISSGETVACGHCDTKYMAVMPCACNCHKKPQQEEVKKCEHNAFRFYKTGDSLMCEVCGENINNIKPYASKPQEPLEIEELQLEGGHYTLKDIGNKVDMIIKHINNKNK